jgi:DNA-directed RNA polymerase subunit RPC12/RpoP
MLIKIIIVTLVVLALAYPIQYLKSRFFDYQCGKCGGIFNIPAWRAVLSLQILGIRYIKCLKCGRWTYAKLILKENNRP